VSLPRRLSALAAGLAALPAFVGCSGSDQPHAELPTRYQIPIPVCTTPLPPVTRKAGGRAEVRNLDPEQWMSVLSPTFNATQGVGPTDIDCTGHYLFANESLRGGISQKGWPRPFDPDELEIRTGPEGMRVIWMRVLKFENGDVGGPVALVRALDDKAEVFGIGSFRGPAKSKISPVRDDCRKRADFYLARRGRLIDSAQVDLERTQVVPSVTERGLYAKYTLKTDVTYKTNGIQLLEQVQVKIIHYEAGDRDSDRNLRKVEFSRFLRVERDTLFSSNDPLWERVVGQD
jgi:hypothetical protein